MDIAEKRVPQDGAIALRTGDKRIDLRVSTVPTVYGEKMVMRILDKGAIPIELTGLGFDERQSKDLIESIQMPHGLMLVTGPTGSGKSTTLYACLNQLNEPDTNICTVEDPVEYKFKGINQVQVKTQVGLTFAGALRAFLRQDPDVIMVGEVRDQETAQICLRAALTGHFVLSTIHTNDSLSAVNRLVDMGDRAVPAGLDAAGAGGPAAHPPAVQGVQGAVRVRRRDGEAARPRGRADAVSAQGLRLLPRHRLQGPRRRVRGRAHHQPHGQPDPDPRAAARTARRRPRGRHETAVGQRHGQSAGRIDQFGGSLDRGHERGGVDALETMTVAIRRQHDNNFTILDGVNDVGATSLRTRGVLLSAATDRVAGRTDRARQAPSTSASAAWDSPRRSRWSADNSSAFDFTSDNGSRRGNRRRRLGQSRLLPCGRRRQSHRHRVLGADSGIDATGVGAKTQQSVADRRQNGWLRHATAAAAAKSSKRSRDIIMAFEDWFIARARVSSKPHKKITLDDKMIFFQQLSTLVSSGTPLLQALEISAEQSQSLKLRQVLEQIASRVASGSSVHAAAANYPGVFEHYWIEVIRTGEITGQMSLVLGELNKQIAASRETRRKVMGALMYPIILICVAVIAVTAMLWLVVPTFAKMFKDMGAELPGITQFVVDLSDCIVIYGPYVVVGLIVAVFAIRKYAKTEAGRRRFIGIGIGLPMVGELIVQAAMYRFASNIALLLKSGIPMMETLQTVEGVFQTSPLYRDAMARVQSRVAAGRPLAASLEETRLFTTMITNMVRVGEESGQLAIVMEQMAPYYKERMETMIHRVTKLLEPIIIMGMGITVAGLMLSIYMPMFEMAGKIK